MGGYEMKEYSLGLYEKSMPNHLTWREKLSCAKTLGFDFIEISIDDTHEKLSRLYSSKEERIEIVKQTFEVGMPIETLCLSSHRKYPIGSSYQVIRNKGLEIMERAIDLACDLGARIILLNGYDVYHEPSTDQTRAFFRENIYKCATMAAKRGLILGIETMDTEFMNTVGKAMDYIEEVKSPYLKIYPDAGNLTNAAVMYSKDVLQDLKLGASHIVAMHLKESLPGIVREIPYGTGHVQFEKIIKLAWSLDVRKYVAELWYTGSKNWFEEIKAAKLFLDNKFNLALSW